MAVKNKIDTSAVGDNRYMDTREIKATPVGVKVRLYGDQNMGHSYFQLRFDDKGEPVMGDNGKQKIDIIQSVDFPEMENQTDGYQGAEQKPAVCLYSIAWNYETESPVLLKLDKASIINAIVEVDSNDDLKEITYYDFKISFDNTKAPADKYQVVRLDATKLTKEQEEALKAFATTCDLEAYADGEEAFGSDF